MICTDKENQKDENISYQHEIEKSLFCKGENYAIN